MTEQELRKLNRLELLELLLEEVRENERLRAQLAEANRKLQDRRIQTERAGSIAQAALQLNGVFEAAQKAAAQYVENVRRLADERYGTSATPAAHASSVAHATSAAHAVPAPTAWQSAPAPTPAPAPARFAQQPAQSAQQPTQQPMQNARHAQPAPRTQPAPRPVPPVEDEDPYEAAARRFVAGIREGGQRP